MVRSVLLSLVFGSALVAAEPRVLLPPRNGDVYVIAHRGAHQGIPENTLAAYARAIEIGADFVEIDLRTTKDGELVSIHDDTVDAYITEGTRGRVRDLTLKQLKSLDIGSRVDGQWKDERIPTLDEILTLCRHEIGIYLDLKDASIANVASRIEHHGMQRQVVWCAAPGQVDAIRSACSGCIPMPDPESEQSLIRMIEQTKARVVAPVWSEFSSTFAAKCHKLSAIVFVDEKDSSRENWRQALDWGADGIQTDDPAKLIEFINARSRTNQLKLPRQWEYSAPLVSPEKRAHNPSRAQKDPSVVFYGGKWHVFMTVKLPGRSAIEYCAFEKWEDANASERVILSVSDSDYYCAPQVFFFAPHNQWYLIYQMGVPGNDKMWVAYSTTADINDPKSWTNAKPMLDGGPQDPRKVGGLDYWIICDQQRAYLFYTSLNGKMWRMSTDLDDFPRGFGHCEVALEAKVFEASHTYRLMGMDKYLTIIEQNGRRHYKAYVSDTLDGKWTPLADTERMPFAGAANIRPSRGTTAWTDNVSHGELIREGYDQTPTIDPDNLRFLFQGMLEADKGGTGYGQFQWRLGMLVPASSMED